MKKVLLTGMIGTLFAVSCSSANQAQNARADFMKLKGSWEISSVDYDKQYKIKPFDEGADAQCFVGSQWNLVPNNNTGSYALAGGGDCPTVTRAIKFDVSKDKEFSFKVIDAGVKAKKVTAGYVLDFQNQTPTTFTLVQNVPFEGKILKVYYNFTKK
jgi:hypothetical protein